MSRVVDNYYYYILNNLGPWALLYLVSSSVPSPSPLRKDRALAIEYKYARHRRASNSVSLYIA